MPRSRVKKVLSLVAAAAAAAALPALAAPVAHVERPARNSPPSFKSAVSGLEKLPGKVGLLVTRDGKTLAAHNDAAALAVGSGSRLAILAALEKSYANGKLKPDAVVRLQDGDKVPIGGTMQDWPSGTPVTIASTATLMVAMGDSTASDLLMRVLGRDAVEAEAPARDRPFLTARELYVLKAPANASLASEWAKARDPAARTKLLAKLDALPLPARRAQPPTPREPAAQWFFTPQEMCSLMNSVADAPVMGINRGIPLRGWKHVAFSGGADPGILDMTFQLVAKDGSRYCVTVTWNDNSELGRYKFTELVLGLANSLKH